MDTKIWVPWENIYTPKRVWPSDKHKQRGSIGTFHGVVAVDVGGLEVSPNTSNNNQTSFGVTCHAGVRYGSDGVETGEHFDGVFHLTRGDWLDSGGSDEVWIDRTINSGALNEFDPGAGRKILSTSRTFGTIRTTIGTQLANVTFDFWDAASGGNMIGSVTINLNSIREDL